MSIDDVSLLAVPRSLSRDAERAFRDRLCRIAARQFATFGYAGVTLRALAEELGCSRMTPYRYFADKGEILAAVRARGFGRLAEINEKVAARNSDPIACIQALGRAYVRFARDEPDSYRLMYESASDTEGHRYPELARQLARSVRPLRRAVRDAVDRGLIRGEANTVAHVCWSALHGAIALHLAGKLEMGLDLDAISEATIEALLRGLLVRGAAAGGGNQ